MHSLVAGIGLGLDRVSAKISVMHLVTWPKTKGKCLCAQGTRLHSLPSSGDGSWLELPLLLELTSDPLPACPSSQRNACALWQAAVRLIKHSYLGLFRWGAGTLRLWHRHLPYMPHAVAGGGVWFKGEQGTRWRPHRWGVFNLTFSSSAESWGANGNAWAEKEKRRSTFECIK